MLVEKGTNTLTHTGVMSGGLAEWREGCSRVAIKPVRTSTFRSVYGRRWISRTCLKIRFAVVHRRRLSDPLVLFFSSLNVQLSLPTRQRNKMAEAAERACVGSVDWRQKKKKKNVKKFRRKSI